MCVHLGVKKQQNLMRSVCKIFEVFFLPDPMVLPLLFPAVPWPMNGVMEGSPRVN